MAVTLPREIQDLLEAVAAPLRAVGRGVTWVRAANLHLTLKFLGDIEDHRVGEIGAALAVAAAGVRAFELGLCGVGAFPTLARPRVIWVGTQAAGLPELAQAVERALEPLGFPREARGFSAHVTLGRVRSPARNPALAEALARAAGADVGHTRVERIVLMRSQLSPGGSRYAELAGAPLASSS